MYFIIYTMSFKSGVFHKLRKRLNSNFAWNSWSNNFLEIFLEIIPDEKGIGFLIGFLIPGKRH